MQAMLPCIACKRHVIEDEDEDEDEDDYSGGRGGTIAKAEVKSLSSQLKDVVLKVSAAYRQCRPCSGSKGNTFEQEFTTDASSSEDHWIQKSGMLKKDNYPSSVGSSISEGTASAKQDDLSSSKVSPSSQASSSSSNGSGTTKETSKPDRRNQQHNKSSNGASSSQAAVEDASQEWVAQVEPGVLITFIAMPNGENELKRIRFSREIFNKWQAEAWWAENCERVHELYNVSGNDHSFPSGRKDQAEAQTSQASTELPKSKLAPATSEELTEWVEEDEPGVYITVKLGPNGNRELKRVRFSREKFSERQAKLWWERNRFRIHDNYL